jgi:hypothetical protein
LTASVKRGFTLPAQAFARAIALTSAGAGVFGPRRRIRRTVWPAVARRRPDDRWHRHPEPLGEQPQVVVVGGVQRVTEVMTDL